jgi:hypothetical protein
MLNVQLYHVIDHKDKHTINQLISNLALGRKILDFLLSHHVNSSLRGHSEPYTTKAHKKTEKGGQASAGQGGHAGPQAQRQPRNTWFEPQKYPVSVSEMPGLSPRNTQFQSQKYLV